MSAPPPFPFTRHFSLISTLSCKKPNTTTHLSPPCQTTRSSRLCSPPSLHVLPAKATPQTRSLAYPTHHKDNLGEGAHTHTKEKVSVSLPPNSTTRSLKLFRVISQLMIKMIVRARTLTIWPHKNSIFTQESCVLGGGGAHLPWRLCSRASSLSASSQSCRDSPSTSSLFLESKTRKTRCCRVKCLHPKNYVVTI